MGMATGESKDGPVSDPNIVPLIDVLLVLIIIIHGDHSHGTHWIAHAGSSTGFGAIETRTTRSPYDRGAGAARREAHD